jgi:hypothetical protein
MRSSGALAIIIRAGVWLVLTAGDVPDVVLPVFLGAAHHALLCMLLRQPLRLETGHMLDALVFGVPGSEGSAPTPKHKIRVRLNWPGVNVRKEQQ